MKNISLFLLICTLFIVALAGNSFELWPASLVGILPLTATVLLLLGACLKRFDLIRVIGTIPLFLFLLVPLFQLIPLPPLLVEAISPATYKLYEPLPQLTGIERWIPLSVTPQVTLLEFFQLAGYACTYILTVQLLANPSLLKKSVISLVVVGSGLALWSIVQTVILGSATSSGFVALLLLTCPIAFSLSLYYRPVFYRDEGWRNKVVLLFTEPGLYRHYYFGCSGVLMMIATGMLGDSFEEVYSYIFLPGAGFVPDHLHASDLMLPVEIGAAGVMLGIWFLLAIMWQVFKKIQVREDRFVVLVGTGVGVGVVLFLAHLFWHPSSYGGLAGVHLFFFLGLLVAITHCRFSYQSPGTLLNAVSPVSRFFFTTLAVALLCISLVFHGGVWYAWTLQNSVTFVSTSVDLSAVLATVDPLESAL